MNNVIIRFRPLRKATATRKVGDVRPAITVQYEPVETNDPMHPQLSDAANYVLEQYAQALVNERSDDWDYVPSVDEVTLTNWHRWETTVASRKREVTAATLGKFADAYVEWAQTVLGKTEAVAMIGAQVIRDKMIKIVGSRELCGVMLGNIEAIVSGVDESELAPHEAVISWIVDKLTVAAKIEVTADSL